MSNSVRTATSIRRRSSTAAILATKGLETPSGRTGQSAGSASSAAQPRIAGSALDAQITPLTEKSDPPERLRGLPPRRHTASGTGSSWNDAEGVDRAQNVGVGACSEWFTRPLEGSDVWAVAGWWPIRVGKSVRQYDTGPDGGTAYGRPQVVSWVLVAEVETVIEGLPVEAGELRCSDDAVALQSASSWWSAASVVTGMVGPLAGWKKTMVRSSGPGRTRGCGRIA